MPTRSDTVLVGALFALAACAAPRIGWAQQQEALERHIAQEGKERFEACKAHSPDAGPVQVDLLISLRHPKARVERAWASTQLGSCLRAALEALEYPSWADGEVVRLTFVGGTVRISPPPQVPTQDDSAAEKPWYGGRILAGDIIGTGLLVSGIISATSGDEKAGFALMTVGGVLMVLWGPAHHLYMGRPGAAGRSVLRRILLPAAGGAPGLILYAAGGRSLDLAAAGIILSVVGATAGFITAAVFDARDAYPEAPKAAESTAIVLPSLGVSADGTPVLGLVGRF